MIRYSDFKNFAFQSTPSAWRETGQFRAVPPDGWKFQSTPSAWRETWCFFLCHYDPEYFNPLPPHGGRPPIPIVTTSDADNFNPLPPHGGRQAISLPHQASRSHFNPLPPHGGRRNIQKQPIAAYHFNPLPPHGGRQHKSFLTAGNGLFQSTPSAWRETTSTACLCSNIFISIHSLRMEETVFENCNRCGVRDFNPLPPHGGRHWYSYAMSEAEAFQSTPSAWRETIQAARIRKSLPNFNPLPPHGGRHI